MTEFRITPLRKRPDLTARAAAWFHAKWNIPERAYLESITACQQDGTRIPQWYLVLCGDEIAGGLGAIENDFHKRTDLTPNVCAVYVEPPYRGQGVAKAMLDFVCRDLAEMGCHTLYLLTSHTSFYEKCGWEYTCMAEDDSGGLSRVYRKQTV